MHDKDKHAVASMSCLCAEKQHEMLRSTRDFADEEHLANHQRHAALAALDSGTASHVHGGANRWSTSQLKEIKELHKTC
jgi:hypothetical protein